MENINKNDLNAIFLDVRNSYRLLFKYQKRILDLVKYAGNYLKFSYDGGWPWFSDASPRKGKGTLDNWPWDWLNMYLYDFHFKEKEIEATKINFSIVIQSDTGHYDSKFPKNETLHKCDIDEFSNPKTSETRLIFIASKKGWDMDELFLLHPKTTDYKLSKIHTEWETINADYHMIAKAYPLADFINQTETDKKLEDFITYCISKEILLKEIGEI